MQSRCPRMSASALSVVTEITHPVTAAKDRDRGGTRTFQSGAADLSSRLAEQPANSSVAAAGISAQAADECADSDTPAVQVTVPLVGADLEKPVMNADVFAS